MPLTLYHGEPNGPSLTVLATLFEKGIDAELRRIDLAAGERHGLPFAEQTEVAMSLEGEGPVLIAEDGTAMTDAVFIALYLDDLSPSNPLRPADAYGHYQLNMWCRFIDERVSPAAALLGTRAYRPRADETATSKVASQDLLERWQAAGTGRFQDAQVTDSEGKIRAGVERTERQLGDGDWILDAFSIADLETYAWLAGMADLMPDAFRDAPRTKAWLERVKARPSVQKALATATSADPLKVWVPGPEINRWG